MGNDSRIHAGGFGERADHEALGNTHAKLAGNDLVPGEALGLVHLAPGPNQRLALGGIVPVAERKQALFDPVVQRPLGGGFRFRQQQGDGLGEIAHGVEALAE